MIEEVTNKMLSERYSRVGLDLQIWELGHEIHGKELIVKIPPKVWLLKCQNKKTEVPIYYVATNLPDVYVFVEEDEDFDFWGLTYLNCARPEETLDDLIWHDPKTVIDSVTSEGAVDTEHMITAS